jgi:hypothetical protein
MSAIVVPNGGELAVPFYYANSTGRSVIVAGFLIRSMTREVLSSKPFPCYDNQVHASFDPHSRRHDLNSTPADSSLPNLHAPISPPTFSFLTLV